MPDDLSHYRDLLSHGIVVIDVRTPAEFESVHATGALSEPLDRLDPASVMARLPPDAAVHLICQSGSRAAKARERFQAAGFDRVMVVPGGTTAWIGCGLPVTHGRKTMPLERQVRIAAGALVLGGVLLGALVDPWLYAIAGSVGAGLIFAGVTDICAMGMMLARMPWNRVRGSSSAPLDGDAPSAAPSSCGR